MLSVRVWNLESDRDAEAVRLLEHTFLRFRQLEYVAIRTIGRSALRKCYRKGTPITESLRKAIQHYLKQDDSIIFVIDADQQKSSPLVDELGCVIKECDFSDRVFFAPDIQEGESATPMQWQSIILRFQTEVESDRKRFQEKWNKTMAHFHDAFADTPEEEVIRDFEEVLAEVKCERLEAADSAK